jgi:HEAT repeat protein
MQFQCIRREGITALLALASLINLPVLTTSASTPQDNLTPLKAAIRQQQTRLSSGDDEERRDAVMRLGLLHHPDASRTALPALSDLSIAVRVAAVTAVLSLPGSESAASLIPLLNDKNDFVRQETAYALGHTGSRSAVAPLLELLRREKQAGVRGAIVVSLGRLRDESAVVPLAQLLGAGLSGKGKGREQNVLVLRAAAESLGEIGSRAGVPALISLLENTEIDSDIRRGAAEALGRIRDPAASSALRATMTSTDPYLARAAEESLRRIENR